MRRLLSGAGWMVGAALAYAVVASSALAISSAVNLSTRMVVQTGDNVLIGGFIVYGSGQKKIAVRALGPSLPVPGVKLSDPMVELHDATGAIIASFNFAAGPGSEIERSDGGIARRYWSHHRLE